MQAALYGFRIVGNCREDRRLVDAAAAFVGYADCVEQAEVNHESYLSAFQFGDAFRQLLEMTGSPKGYNGVCWSRWLWFDIDREENIDTATSDARRLAAGLCDRYQLDGDELLQLKTAAIVELARTPEPFDLPPPSRANRQAADDWQAAIETLDAKNAAHQQRRIASNGSATLNRATLEFIREGANAGDRHRLLFSAAANLAEFGCPPELAHALLSESALDSGLPPKEVRRQVDCGLNAVTPQATPQIAAHKAGTNESN